MNYVFIFVSLNNKVKLILLFKDRKEYFPPPVCTLILFCKCNSSVVAQADFMKNCFASGPRLNFGREV